MDKRKQFVLLGLLLPLAMSIGTILAIYASNHSNKAVAFLIAASIGLLVGLIYLLMRKLSTAKSL